MYQVSIKNLPQTLSQNEIEEILKIKDKHQKFEEKQTEHDKQIIISFNDEDVMQQVLMLNGCDYSGIDKEKFVWCIEQYKTQEDIRTHLFELNADDSSDDEDTAKRINDYDIGQRKESGIEKLRELYIEPKDAEASFQAHALGLKLLYSPEVNQLYYPLKEKLLKSNTVINEDKLKAAIILALEDAIKNSPILVNAVKFFYALPDNLLEQYVSAEKNFIQTTTNIILGHKRSIFRIKRDDSVLQECIKDSAKAVYHNFMFYMQRSLKTPRQIEEISYVSVSGADNVSYQSEVGFFADIYRVKSLEYYRDAALLQGSALYLAEHKPLKKADRIQRLQVLANNDGTPCIFPAEVRAYLRKLIEDANTNKLIKNILNAHHDNTGYGNPHHLKFTTTYITCLQDEDTQANYQQYSNFAIQYPFIQRYLSCTFARFSPHIEIGSFIENFGRIFSRNIVMQLAHFEIKIDRTILPQVFKLSSYNAPSFFAQVRLSNRSKSREIKQIKDGLLYDMPKSHRSWSLFDKLEVPVVLEPQEITVHKYRNDLVNTLGKYISIKRSKSSVLERIEELISNMRTELALFDENELEIQLAQWIRMVLKGEYNALEQTVRDLETKSKKSLTKVTRLNFYNVLNNITYLFFGIEATRNPSSLITNQMLLDSIIQAKLSWQNALGNMVMAPKGATSAARCLNFKLKDTMPVSFFYQASEDQKNITAIDIVKREAKVINNWCALTNKNLGELPYKEWFGFTP